MKQRFKDKHILRAFRVCFGRCERGEAAAGVAVCLIVWDWIKMYKLNLYCLLKPNESARV